MIKLVYLLSLVVYLLSFIVYLFLPSPVRAFNLFDLLRPATVNSSIRNPPKKSASDRYDKTPDFNTNDPKQDDVDVCNNPTAISQSYDPDCSETQVKNSDGTTTTQRTCRKYLVERVEQSVSDNQKYNRAPAILQAWFSNEPQNPILTGEDKKRAFLSFDTQNSLSSAERMTTYKEQICLKGRRLYRALDSLDPENYTANNTTVDVQVALDCNGQVTSTPTGSNCRPIPLSEIVHYLRPALYNPTQPCTDDSSPIPYPSKLKSYLSQTYESCNTKLCYFRRYGKNVTPISDYQTLYNNLTLTDANAIAAQQTVNNITLGGSLAPTPQLRNIARLGVANPNTDDLLKHAIPSQETLIKLDPCAKGAAEDGYDGSNTLTWTPAFDRDYGKKDIWVSEDAVTATSVLPGDYKIPSQVNKSFSAATTLTYLLTPYQDQKDAGFDNFPDNSGSRYPDQGNRFRAIYESVFWKQFYPLSDQNL